MWEWLAENGCRPHILVDINAKGLQVPAHLRNREVLALNIAMHSTHNLQMGNLEITCGMTFNGAHASIVVPMDAIMAIYSPDAPANGVGYTFPIAAAPSGEAAHEVDISAPSADNTTAEATDKKRPPFLTVVK